MVALAPDRSAGGGELTGGDRLAIALVALVAFGTYLATLFPGLGGGGDSAKFQYVGHVLGTPHSPGYPLYVVVSYCFSQFPVGTVAWRVNVMSAIFAATSVALCAAVLLRTGCRRTAAMSAALALAFGDAVWSKATRAEVYSLGGALVAAIVFLGVRWQVTRRDRDLYLMVGAFALSLGNHLTVTTLVPGMLAFVLLTEPGVIRLRTVFATAAIVVAGLAQYGFILLRTWQGAPYLEAQARNLRELLAVMRATRYSYQIFAFSPRELLLERVPALWHLCAAELNSLGVLLALAGGLAVVLRRMRVGALLILGAAGIVFLTLNVDADVEGFLLPAFVLVWMLAGIGLDALWRLPRVPATRAGVAALMAVTVALPALQVARNYRANDHHRRTYEIRYFDALFSRLEPRAAIVRENYAVDQLVLYKLLGERAEGSRTVRPASADPDVISGLSGDGFAVYAFSGSVRALQSRGFRFEPVALSSPASTPIDMAPLPLFRLTRAASCRDVANLGWQDITSIVGDGPLLLRIDNYRPFDARVVLYVGHRATVGRPLLVASRGPSAPRVSGALHGAGSSPVVAAALARDAVQPADALLHQELVDRIELTVNDAGESAWAALDVGRGSDVVLIRATVDLDNPRRASVCGWAGEDFLATVTARRIGLGADAAGLLGQGWSAPERSSAGTMFRWTVARDAELLVPLARTGPMRVTLAAHRFAAPGDRPSTFTISVNGTPLPPQEVTADWREFEWTVAGEMWRPGFNRLTISTSTLTSPAAVSPSSDRRTLGIAVTDVSLELRPGAR